MKKRFSIGFIVGAIAVLLSLVSVGRAVLAEAPTSPRAGDKAKAARKLGAPNDDRLDVPEGQWVSGAAVVEPRDRETRLAAESAGVITKILVKEGDRVKVGDALVEMEDRVERSTVASAEADLAASRGELDRALNGARPEDRRAASADTRAAEARARLSEATSHRLGQAAEGGGATIDEADRAAKQAEVDRATAEATLARSSAVSAGSRYEDISIAKAKLAASSARLDEAKARLAQKTITSPIEGDILEIKVRVGEHYQPGADPLLVLGDTSLFRARIDVDERDLAKLQPGSKTILRAAAYPGRDIEAHVTEIGRRMGRKNVRSDDPVERNDTKILEVVAEIDEREGLYVGQRLTAFIASP